MTLTDLFLRFGIALVLGALPGLEREYDVESSPNHDRPAGARTFALLALVGCTSAFAADKADSAWVFAALMLAMVGLVTAGYVVSAQKRTGMTTEVAAILILLVGALCYWDELSLAGALSVTITVLLSMKGEIQKFVRNLTPEDLRATLAFAVISVIVLPILPDEGIGEKPFDVLNPYQIWLMVVFISGISFLGYSLNKLLGTSRGVILSGILGGVVSSTASTLSFAHRSKENPELSNSLALAILLAWTVMYARIAIIVGVVSPKLFETLWLPLLVNGLVGMGYAAWLYFSQRNHPHENVEYANPFRLKPAIQFGGLFAAVLLFSRIAQTELGDYGIYFSSLVSGLVDVNAITLSVADFVRVKNMDESLAARAVILAGISNTLFKGGVVYMNSAPSLRKPVSLAVVLLASTGIVAIFLI